MSGKKSGDWLLGNMVISDWSLGTMLMSDWSLGTMVISDWSLGNNGDQWSVIVNIGSHKRNSLGL